MMAHVRGSGDGILRGRVVFVSVRLGVKIGREKRAMRIAFSTTVKYVGTAVVALGLLACGYVAGQTRLGQPKTIIHVVEIKWNPGVSEIERQKVLDGMRQVAMKTPGVKNIWVKADRLEPRDFNAAFAIEFQNRDAADAYAESAAHDAWDKMYVPLRQASISIQVTNP